MSEGW